MVSKPDPEIDSRLSEILQNVKQIDLFMDAVFSFLYRRTDFYHIMKSKTDTMGLPPGAARKLIMQAYMKYEQLSQGVSTVPPSTTSIPEAESTVEVETTEKPHIESTPKEREQVKDKAEQKTLSNTSRDQTGSQKVSSKAISEADTFNGAMCDTYSWSQSLKDVDIKVPVPQHIKKAKQLMVEVQSDSIKVALKSNEPSGSPEVLVEGKLKAQIKTEESMWSLIPGECVQLNLEKRVETWWHAALENEPEIDPKTINNSQSLNDLDEDDKQGFRQAMFDYEQKQQGKPTSQELKAHEVLKKAWDVEGSPFKGQEYDPSVLNIATS
ncbi:nudC domain-containing protein 3-like [Anneissia japonica]|uniref:nudC domain-containing protein 3-like n=1 Tax=Anneissia japonica TaxID=1529436 RepID=UPI001425A050|nr:nudC domain-containing protein 3-like [Anneissia japonica]